MKKASLGFCICLFWLLPKAQELRVAAAANTQFVMKALAADFEKTHGISPQVIIGSSGKLAAQVQHGAPYDIFLSADNVYPQKLFQLGFAMAKPQIYALGSLIVCSKKHNIKTWKNTLNTSVTIAIANPDLAPYGEAAQVYLEQQKLWERIQKKLVFGESIAQVNTYITEGIVDFGFTTEALMYESGNKQRLSWTRIPKTAYPPIQQAMVWLKRARHNQAAAQFYRYLLSKPAKKIFQQYGYQTF